MGKYKQGNQIEDLSKEEMMEIYNRSQSGIYCIKEICARFNITYYTYQKIINKVHDYIQDCLNGKKTESL